MNKINFKNLPDTSTPLSAENLNLLQDNVEDAIPTIDNAVSTSSTNGIENQAITNYVNSTFVMSNDLADVATSGDYDDLLNKPTILNATLLYSDSTGSNTTTQLNDSAANYDFLEIYYRNNDNFYDSIKIVEPDGKKVCLTSTFTGSSNYVLKFAGATISGTTITIDDYWEFNLNGASRIDPGNAYITKVIGYK